MYPRVLIHFGKRETGVITYLRVNLYMSYGETPSTRFMYSRKSPQTFSLTVHSSYGRAAGSPPEISQKSDISDKDRALRASGQHCYK